MYRVIDLRNTASGDRANIGEEVESQHDIAPAVNPHGIAFITPVKDERQYQICLRYIDALVIPQGFSIEKIAVFGGASMAEVYKQAMETSTARYKIYLHVDAYAVHRELLHELLNLFRTYPRLGLVGVEGATRLPGDVLYSVNNPLHCYGRIWDYRRPGGLPSLLGPANRRRLHLSRFRSFVGDYLPAVVVDGFFVATQYDIPWFQPQFGFEFYDFVQSAEFIKRGLEVGIARQEAIWCIHWGPLQELSRQQQARRRIDQGHKAMIFRRLYPAFVGVPARRLYEQHRGVPARVGSTNPSQDHLGAVMVTFNGREVLLHSLRALLLQCEALKDVEQRIVVVDDASTDGTVEVMRQEFPQVTVIANTSNEGPARGFNKGLRHLGFPSYVLVMNNDVEFLPGTLARMVNYLREHPRIAGVAASLTNRDGTMQFQRTAILELVPRRPRRPQPITYVGTTCALVRGDVFFDVGLYDERFDFYNEDLEWSLRAKRKGYKFVFLPEAKVIHQHGVGLRQNLPAIFAERFVGDLWYLYKHGGSRWATAFYWTQRLRAKWLAFRWRRDTKGRRQLVEAMTRMDDLYRRLREENRRPQLLEP